MADDVQIIVNTRVFGTQLAIAVMRVALYFGWSMRWPIFLRMKAGRFPANWHVVMAKLEAP